MSREFEYALSALLLGPKSTMSTYNLGPNEIKKNFCALLKKNQFSSFLREIIQKCVQSEGRDFVVKQFHLTDSLVDAILSNNVEKGQVERQSPKGPDKKNIQATPEQDTAIQNPTDSNFKAELENLFASNEQQEPLLPQHSSEPTEPQLPLLASTNGTEDELASRTPVVVRAQSTVDNESLREQAILKYQETKNFSATALALGINDIFQVVRWVKQNEAERTIDLI